MAYYYNPIGFPYCVTILLVIWGSSLSGQVELTYSFEQLLEENQIEFIYPVENRYKVLKNLKNDFFAPDFAIKSRRDKLEIYYSYKQPNSDQLAGIAPHAASFKTAIHLASNDENSIITKLSIDPQTLEDQFNADWGKVFIFTPKSAFSNRKYCKLVALFKENIGLFYVYFLFDENSREVDNRFYALRFINADNIH